MNTTYKATGTELTDAIREYIDKRLETLGKLVPDEALVHVEVSQTTKHHKQGDIFRTEIDVRGGGVQARAASQKDDLYAAIDDAREELARVLASKKEKSQTLFRRGAASVKKMLKGLSKRNPFTSKY